MTGTPGEQFIDKRTDELLDQIELWIAELRARLTIQSDAMEDEESDGD